MVARHGRSIQLYIKNPSGRKQHYIKLFGINYQVINTNRYICKKQDYFNNRQLKRLNEISIHFMINIQTLWSLKNANDRHG